MSDELDLATVESDRFEPLLNKKFSAVPWEGPVGQPSVELDLVRVVPARLHAQEGRRVPFSLFFNGPAGVHLGQGLYKVLHPQTGEMPLFLVPVASKEERIQLQAVMN